MTIHADYEGVWDMHADGNNLNMIDGMEAVGKPFDHAVAAFIADVEAQGLQDKILLVCCGEMGRTPRLNKNGGRDHWAKLAPLLFYGGGCQGGRVIGQSTRDGGRASHRKLYSRPFDFDDPAHGLRRWPASSHAALCPDRQAGGDIADPDHVVR